MDVDVPRKRVGGFAVEGLALEDGVEIGGVGGVGIEAGEFLFHDGVLDLGEVSLKSETAGVVMAAISIARSGT